MGGHSTGQSVQITPKKIPLQRANKSAAQLKGQNFLHLRDTAMNKPVKHGLDLLNTKTTGLKYIIWLERKGNVPSELSNGRPVLPSAKREQPFQF